MRYILLFLAFIGVTFASSYPKLYAQLSDPLYEAASYAKTLPHVGELNTTTQTFISKADEALQKGLTFQNTQENQQKIEYLKSLRALQKEYDYFLHVLHQEINSAIDKKDYKLFTQLTAYKYDGLWQKRALYNKAKQFYKANKGYGYNKILDEQIRENELIEETREAFYSAPVSNSYTSENIQKQTKKDVYIEVAEKGIEYNFIIHNKKPYTITMKVDMQLSGLEQLNQTNEYIVLKPHTTKTYLKAKVSSGSIGYNFHYTWNMGSINAKHDDSYIYRLPFAVGENHMVSQGYNGKYTHKGRSRYAIDFVMDIGTKLYAARDGVVVKIKSDSKKRGESKEFSSDANYIMIEHSDGTFSLYAHLRYQGVKVKVGDVVKQGDFIGFSGNTGYSTGPHLHFAVLKNINLNAKESLPIRFNSDKGIVSIPIERTFYAAK
ncbi:M23 family metallopeptidase [Sulfurimonas sp.]|uniref:M23 family metallopeptidase n=1 Tax=Sulfurimonas sp. TaxID=2022749 RepID=UPI003D0F0AB5